MPKTPLKLKQAQAQKAEGSVLAPLPGWKILVVDDSPEVHAVTQLILGDVVFKDRPLQLINAYSAREARQILTDTPDIAVCLLDVVMETEHAGLDLVKDIRQALALQSVRIILRTGQPGQAPEKDTVLQYDINDYRAKNELSAQTLFSSVIAALRNYETLKQLEHSRRGLELILQSADKIFELQGMNDFASMVLEQLSIYLECEPNGILCLDQNKEYTQLLSQNLTTNESLDCNGNRLQIIAAAGEFRNKPGAFESNTPIKEALCKAAETGANQTTATYTVLVIKTDELNGYIALAHGPRVLSVDDQQLLELFAQKISAGTTNVLHYSQMVSAEEAANTDYLTGLSNRRQLIEKGIAIWAGAQRSKTPLAVAMIDMDHFKHINDSYGHATGDLVLKQVASILQKRARDSDLVARFGGEEFVIVAQGNTAAQAQHFFEELRKLIEQASLDVDGTIIKVTVSIGVATELSDSLDEMINQADKLLYKAKQSGRNRVIVA